jgi:nicotinamidase-related amidase
MAAKPRKSGTTALVIVDMMNTLAFPEGVRLARRALPAARRMAQLKARFIARNAPVVYANDNFGAWHADFRTLVERCAAGKGAALVELLRPDDDDYYILKPRHSAFFATPLDILLRQLGVERVVLCGIASDMCVAASAIDARMLGYTVHVPADCVQAETGARNTAALRVLRESFEISTVDAAYVRL